MVSHQKTILFGSSIRRRHILLSIIAFIIILYYCTSETSPAEVFQYPCYMDSLSESSTKGLERLEDVLLSDRTPPPGRSIFFHETKCHPSDRPNIFNLSARQACSIESAALNNPNFQVYLLFATPTYTSDDQKNPILDALRSYKNINLRSLNIWRYAKDTPIEQWVKKGDVFQSKFLTEHMSDLLRLITLYRFGGIYMDLDVVVLRSMELVPLNYVGAHDNVTLGNAVISVEPRGIGHEISELFLDYYQKHYSADVYVSNGPTLVSRVVKGFCNHTSMKQMQEDPKNCRGFKVFNETAFYPLQWPQWQHFILPEFKKDTLEKTKDSYLIHFWNKSSYQKLFKVGTDNAYGSYASANCPKTYAAAAGTDF
ncbi:lactosylceramide 4-alpha-galactosyltransferase-like isoform X1 [Drosophila albomicans]|uniref:Lactosylceramide 4-alpha-galactosyltransferase-like isoform X1 n=1 Tax=Drosophila albomicans TaxID=7291 RepID=A0A6P8XN99_DROAB|nr:lactosylceramide 4-alpha-galactosyltransferase-like isoform X1 [Drosophila albomicans]